MLPHKGQLKSLPTCSLPIWPFNHCQDENLLSQRGQWSFCQHAPWQYDLLTNDRRKTCSHSKDSWSLCQHASYRYDLLINYRRKACCHSKDSWGLCQQFNILNSSMVIFYLIVIQIVIKTSNIVACFNWTIYCTTAMDAFSPCGFSNQSTYCNDFHIHCISGAALLVLSLSSLPEIDVAYHPYCLLLEKLSLL